MEILDNKTRGNVGGSMKNFKKSNKSSIIRVIISNFDDQYIKEIKVLYKKQGGVDTFKINKMSYDDLSKDIIFEQVENKSKYIDINKNCFKVTKRDKYSNKEVRKYRLSGKFQKTKEGKILVTVCVEDYLIGNFTEEQIKKRVKKSSTERLLLSKEIIKNYSDIAECSEDEIDSQKIYKVNKFLSYRSNMLIYFNFINDFLIKGTDYQEIWKISSDDREKVTSQAVNNFQKHSHKFIENHNNYAKKQNQKIEDNKWKDRDKIPELNILVNENICKDVEKIIEIFTELRHNIMHYKYSYFEKLFTGGDIQVSDKNLAELLDLNMFQEMLKIKGIKEDKITNYLEEGMELRILGKSKDAKKAYNIYYKICNRKNGFNSFINSLLTVDGEENKDVKKEIEKQFLQQKEFLLTKIKSKKAKPEKIERMKIELKEMEEILHLVGAPYIWDIHQCRAYKDLYNKKKEKVEEQNKLIVVGRNDSNKKAITNINKELKKLKDKMEKITKLDSKFRLQYKLQIAYGFLQKEYDLDLKKFGDWFEPSKENSIKEFQVRWLEYLKVTVGKKELDFGILEKSIKKIKKSEESFLIKDKSNNLVKLYILIYLLIPTELRGDFLGFVKKNYYDMKNVDQLSEDIEVKDEFFHKLRLFEKNSKKFEMLSYEMIEYSNINEDFTKVYESLGIDISKVSIVQFVGLEEKRIFDKNIILPMMKYYQNIFKLINDVEIHALFKSINGDKHMTFEEGIKEVTKKTGNFNFLNLMNKIKNDSKSKTEKSEIYGIRNDIAHINYSNLFLNPFTGTPLLNDKKKKNDKNPYKSDKLSKSSLSERVDNFIEDIKSTSSDKSILGVDIVNDYYMKKEQFLFNLKSTSEEDITSVEKRRKLDQEQESLRRYNLKTTNLPNIFKKYREIVSNLEEGKKINSKLWSEIKDLSIFIRKDEKVIIKDLSIFERLNYIDQVKGLLKKEASQLLGIYRKYVIQNIKAQLLDIFTKKEKRFIRVEAFGNRFKKKKDYEIQLKSNEGLFKVETILKNNKVITEESIDNFKFKVEGCMIKILSVEEKLLNEKNLKTKYIQKIKLSSTK